MSEKKESLAEFRVKFFWESLRSIVFGITVAMATYFVFKPFEAKMEFDAYTEKLKQEYDAKFKELNIRMELDYGFHLKKKMVETRIPIVDEFIVKSDQYTKLARNVFESEKETDKADYEEDVYHAYKLQIARMHAVFGNDLSGEIKEALSRNATMHGHYKAMVRPSKDSEHRQPKDKDIWEPAIDALVEANTAVTNKAMSIQFEGGDP